MNDGPGQGPGPPPGGAGMTGRATPAVGAAAAAVFALTLPIYLVTMNRTIGFVDRGELAAVAWTFGIPHATGYPTLMLIAGALSHLVPLRPVLALNAFAAVLVAASAAALVPLFERVLAAASPATPAGARTALAALAALGGAAFTMTWWQQANGFEVYALHVLMMPLVVLCFLRWIDAAGADPVAPSAPGSGAGSCSRSSWGSRSRTT